MRYARDLSKNDQQHRLIRWWCAKYKLPPTDERLAAYTLVQLEIEFFEDLWDEKPEKAAQLAGVEPDTVSGDAEMDEVARRIMEGEDPDEVLKEWEEERAGGSVTNEPLTF